MPIEKEEFQGGKFRDKLEEDIVLFLKERAEKAFTSLEIMDGMVEHLRTDFTSPDIAQMSAFAIGDFTALLYDLVKRGKITMKIIKGQMYFMTIEDTPGSIRCPKCQAPVAEPKKTWMMTGRPNKQGKRLRLQIGLFACPEHGAFRAVLNKQTI